MTEMNDSQAAPTEMEESKSNFIYRKLHDVLSKSATTDLGQYVIRRIDKLLWTIEKTAKWSVPQNYADTDSQPISASPLVRPLPWLLFIPALIALRFIRVALTFIFLCLGEDPVTSMTIVYFIQTRRRKLRAIRYSGLREIRHSRLDASSTEPSKRKFSIFSFFLGLLTALLNIRQIADDSGEAAKKLSKASLDSNVQPTKKRHMDSDPEGNEVIDMDLEGLTTEEFLRKYADYSGTSIYQAYGDSSDTTTSSEEEELNEGSHRKQAISRRNNEDNGEQVTSTPKAKDSKKTPSSANQSPVANDDNNAEVAGEEKPSSPAIVQNGSLPNNSNYSNNKDYNSICSNNKSSNKTENNENVENSDNVNHESDNQNTNGVSNDNEDVLMKQQQQSESHQQNQSHSLPQQHTFKSQFKSQYQQYNNNQQQRQYHHQPSQLPTAIPVLDKQLSSDSDVNGGSNGVSSNASSSSNNNNNNNNNITNNNNKQVPNENVYGFGKRSEYRRRHGQTNSQNNLNKRNNRNNSKPSQPQTQSEADRKF